MARTAVPYEAVTPAVPGDTAPVVGTAPTLQTRTHFGAGSMEGLMVQGQLGRWVPIEHPWAGQGLVSPAFPHYQPSSVAPDAIKPALLTTNNLLQPVSHAGTRYWFSQFLPTPAQMPLTKLPKQNDNSRRPSGAPFTIPYPLNTTEWPTAAQWLASRMRQSQGG